MSIPELPDEFTQLPVRRQAAIEGGIGPDELSDGLWRSPHRGVHVWAAREWDASQRVRAASLLLPPDGALSGWAGLRLHGATILDGWLPDGRQTPVLLCLPDGRHLRERPGVAFFRGRLPAGDVTEVAGVRVTTPARACFDEMRRSTDLTEAVVVADAALQAKLITPSELATYVREHPGWPGVPTARQGVRFADGRAVSPPETRTRMLWIQLAGLPRPEVNVPVYDLDGNLLGIPDLLDEEAGVVVEYDGADHRQLARHTTDNLREELLENAGLIVVRVTGIDLYGERRRTAWRMQRARQLGLSRAHQERRWRRGR